MQVEPDILGRRKQRLAAVDPHPDTKLSAFGPGVLPERPLRFGGCVERAARALEGNDERVAFVVDLVTVVTRAPITGSVVARAARRVPAPSPASTTTRVRFFPNMSPRRPAIGVATDAASR